MLLNLKPEALLAEKVGVAAAARHHRYMNLKSMDGVKPSKKDAKISDREKRVFRHWKCQAQTIISRASWKS